MHLRRMSQVGLGLDAALLAMRMTNCPCLSSLRVSRPKVPKRWGACCIHLSFHLYRTRPALSEPSKRYTIKVERVEADEAKVEEFVRVTVPRVIDEQSGTVTRKLQKARETFDIENAKIVKRERKVGPRDLWYLFFLLASSFLRVEFCM